MSVCIHTYNVYIHTYTYIYAYIYLHIRKSHEETEEFITIENDGTKIVNSHLAQPGLSLPQFSKNYFHLKQ